MPAFRTERMQNPFTPPERGPIPPSETYAFSEDLWKRMVHITRTQLDQTVKQRSFFSLNSLVSKSVDTIRKSLPIRIGDDPDIEKHIEYILQHEDLHQIENSSYYTTGQVLKYEKILIAMTEDNSDDYLLPSEVVEKCIAELTKYDDKGNITEQLSDEQVKAVKVATLYPNRVTIIEGAPGTGKSHAMRVLVNAYTAMGYDVVGTAIAYTAAQNLAKAAGIKGPQDALSNIVSKLESVVGDQGIDFFRKPTVIIVDEAGMADTLTTAKLLWFTKMNSANVKIIITGDSKQLAPVQAGNALELMVDKSPNVVRLSEIRRQNQISHRYFVDLLSQRITGRALYCLEQQESLHWCDNRQHLRQKVVQDYLSYVYNNPNKTSLVLTIENKDVQEINREVRQIYRKLGWIHGEEITVNATDKSSPAKPMPFARGDQLVIRENDKDLLVYKKKDYNSKNPDDWEVNEEIQGVFNRNTGVVADILRNDKGERQLVINLYGDKPGSWAGVVVLNTNTFKPKDIKYSGFPVVHNFGMTVYSSQGQTVDQTFVIHSNNMNSRLIFVAASRHRDGCDYYIDKTEVAAWIDKNRNKIKPKNFVKRERLIKFGQEHPEIDVTTDRYTNSEMLRALAFIWQKESPNQTVHMFMKELLYGKQNVNMQHLLKLTWDAKDKDGEPIPIMDLCPARLEPRKPVIDVKALLDREEVQEEAFIGPTKVERNNMNDKPEMELKEFMGQRAKNPFAKRNYSDIDVPNPMSDIKVEERKVMLSATENVLQTNPMIKEIPFIERLNKGLGVLDDKGNIVFDNEDSTVRDVKLDESLSLGLKEIFWGTGRYSEPRVFARNENDEIVSRYRLDGTCVAGDGYPPMLISEHGDEKSTILIVPGVKEAMLALQSFSEKFKDDKSKIPHIIWAAKDCDWAPISDYLREHQGKVIIARSKIDDRQIEWAQKLCKVLQTVYNIGVNIQPEIPQNNLKKTSKIKP
jgi:ATP-dependent exoDNAse (exonuclease V) alpha subunit